MIEPRRIWLFLILLLPVFANAQEKANDTLISLKLEQTNIRTVLDTISASSGYLFSYNSQYLNDTTKIDINVDSASIGDIIKLIANDRDVQLVRKNRHIIIKKAPRKNYFTLTGSVKSNKEPLIAASVYFKNTFQGVITNADGEFVLKVQSQSKEDTLVFSHLGYYSMEIPLQEIENNHIDVTLKTHSIKLEEIIVSGASARTIVKKMMENLNAHYPKKDVAYTGFYREEVKRGNDYQYFSEAVLKVYKNNYQKTINTERIQRIQSRTIKSASKKDSVLLKIKSGLRTSLYLDVVRNRPSFMHPLTLEHYTYKIERTSYINGEMVYIINFNPIAGTKVRYQGQMVINAENFALEGVDFAYAESRKDALEELVSKRSRGVKKKFNQASYKVRYKRIGNTWYLQRTETLLSVKVKKSGNWFYKPYTSQTAFYVVNTDTTNIQKPRRRESINPSVIFSDETFDYTPEFWGQYDYFKPSDKVINDLKKIEQIERAVSQGMD
ncbi:carboxypeptidase-like regulatory domain-containing protein [Salinivirga cyanobacteriivorans]